MKYSASETAFVIGNGTSRKPIDLNRLAEQGDTYGCNALYREFTPTHLVSVDTKMVKEIVSTGYHLTNPVWSSFNSYTRTVPGIKYFETNLGWSSGPTALYLAAKINYKLIQIIGFDYESINGLVNNVYADTENYKTSICAATYYGNWLKQTATVIRENPQIKFVRVIKDKESLLPEQLTAYSNLVNKTVEEFKLDTNA